MAAFPNDPFLATIIGEVGRLGQFTASNQRLAELFGDDGPSAWAARVGLEMSSSDDGDWATFKKKAPAKK